MLFRVLLIAFMAIVSNAYAVDILSVRFGTFEGRPRCVVELSARTTYRIANLTASDRRLTIEISNVDNAVDTITGTAAGLEGWRIVRRADRKVVHLEITTSHAFRVVDFTLDSPPRIVFDLVSPDASLPPVPADATSANRPLVSVPVTAPATQRPQAPVPTATPRVSSPSPAAPINGPASGSAPSNWVRRIIIDPGHGGHHKGGVGRIGNRTVYEKELVILVAEKLERHLLRDPRFEVRLTRREDVYMSLVDRTIRASQMQGDMFISIHANAVEGREAQARARGFEIWTWNRKANRSAAARAIERLENEDPGMTAGSNRLLTSMMEDALESQALISRRVAQAIHARAIQHPYLARHDRGVDSARFRVLEIYDMPSILVELGFMTHREEVQLLFTDQFQEDWALILYEGIIRYYEQSDPTFPRLSTRQIANTRR